MAGKFPACALHLELGKETVDVNVHPAKMEIRFANEQPVFDAVYYGVKSALREGDSPKVMGLNQPHSYQAPPQKVIPITSISPLGGLETEPGRPLLLKDSAPEQPVPAETPTVQTETKEPSSVQTEPEAPPPKKTEPEPEISVPRLSRAYGDGKLPAVKREPEGFTPLVENALEKRPGAEPPKTEAAPLPLPEIPLEESPRPVFAPLPLEAAQTEEKGEAPSLLGERAFHGKIIGEAFGTYILVEYSPQALMLIDKHAAHERLIYERLKAQGPNGEAQALLERVPVSLEKEEYSAVTANLSRLRETGFEVEDFGPGTVLVRAVPLLLDGGAVTLYLYMLTFLSGSSGWFTGLGLPIVVLVTVIAELVTLCIRKLPRSFLTVSLYLFTALGLLCMGLEMLIRHYLEARIFLTWSAVVLTICTILDIAVITMLSRRRLRNEVRRRLHF